MMLLPITQETAADAFSTELGGLTFGFAFRWNDRASQWVLDVSDGDGVLLAAGVRVTVGVLLLRRLGLGSRFPGDLYAVDENGQNRDAGFEDLGRRVQVYWFSDDELP